MIKIDLIAILVAAIVATVTTTIFIWLAGEIEFKLWWRKWKRFIDKQHDDAKGSDK